MVSERMLIGNKQSFAVEIEILDQVDNWIYGSFIFWLAGFPVGERPDNSVDLKGCINWLKDFVDNPQNRYEADLYEMDKEQAFLLLCSSVVTSSDQVARFAQEKFSETFSRFHISHLGMSSFDRLNLLLVESQDGKQRCIWKEGDQEIKEAYLPQGEMEKVATDAVGWFRRKHRV